MVRQHQAYVQCDAGCKQLMSQMTGCRQGGSHSNSQCLQHWASFRELRAPAGQVGSSLRLQCHRSACSAIPAVFFLPVACICTPLHTHQHPETSLIRRMLHATTTMMAPWRPPGSAQTGLLLLSAQQATLLHGADTQLVHSQPMALHQPPASWTALAHDTWIVSTTAAGLYLVRVAVQGHEGVQVCSPEM